MSPMKRFELLEDLHPMGVAKACLLKWDGAKYIRGQEHIVLHDHTGQHGDRGDRGFAIYSEESLQWEALSGLYEQASMEKFG